MLKKNIGLVVCMVLFLQTINGHAQWTKGKGNGYFKLGAWGLVADEHYTGEGDKANNPERLNLNFSLYGEYGLSKKLDVIGYIPFLSLVSQGEQVSEATGNVLQKEENERNIGDIDLGLRYSLFKSNKLAISGTLLFGLPTGDNKGGSQGNFPTGDGEFNQLVKIDVGTSYQLLSKPSYAKAYVGYNNRTEGFSDEYRLGLETGIKFFDKLWMIGRLNSINSFENGDEVGASSGSIFASDLEFTSLGVEFSYYITPKIGVSLGATGALSGKFVYAAPSYTAGIFFDLK